MPEETQILIIDAVRMGGDRSPCKVITGHHWEGYVVVRGEDDSGTASIVAMLNAEDARNMADALIRAANIVEAQA